MDIREKNVPLRMRHADVSRAPRFVVPDGFSIRDYRTGDEKAWVELHLAADRYSEISTGLYWREFGRDEERLKQRQLYLQTDDGTVLGTTSAWVGNEGSERNLGRIHWVAIHPDWQGRGLAKPLLSAACQRLSELGHTGSYLMTSSARVPALRLYLAFGFLPWPRNGEEQEAWEQLKPWLEGDRG